MHPQHRLLKRCWPLCDNRKVVEAEPAQFRVEKLGDDGVPHCEISVVDVQRVGIVAVPQFLPDHFELLLGGVILANELGGLPHLLDVVAVDEGGNSNTGRGQRQMPVARGVCRDCKR